jgi:hypothetical protein
LFVISIVFYVRMKKTTQCYKSVLTLARKIVFNIIIGLLKTIAIAKTTVYYDLKGRMTPVKNRRMIPVYLEENRKKLKVKK